MWFNLLYLFFLSTIAMTIVSSNEFCPAGFAPFHRDHGYALVGHVIRTLYLFLPDCMTACEETLICFSINVYKNQNSGNVCELNQSNEKQKPESFVRMEGYQYAESQKKRFCVQKDCPEKDALPDDWFYFNSSYLKLFNDKRPWHDARQYCQNLGGDLASIASVTEEEFLQKLMVLEKRSYLLKRLIVDLDTPSSMLSLFNGASLVTLDGKPSLSLDGVDDYATTRGFSTHKSSLTLAVWIKTPNPERTMYIFSDYKDALNAAFRLYIEGKKFVSEIYTAKKNVLRYVSVGSIPANTWLHIAFTWNRYSRIGMFYFNGTLESKSQQTAPDSTQKIFVTGNPTFFIGQDSAGQNRFTGWIRSLVVISFDLTGDEIYEVRDGIFLDGAWIGMNDLTKERTLQWTDGTPLTYKNPVLYLNLKGRDCAVMKKSIWRMEHCNGNAFFICEKK
ncbi:uncharacterized protein LOC116297122 [Actinia tenebrosa]|uniref:Uncharacterized protein LOC116297122 n=1 Tax=Actinia tenebrosa TaxID=6105 RepID=A0A6P8HXP6_ACTTE|nr:uncharacterized protein LOC116297122 [Actinia tenebrosa]